MPVLYTILPGQPIASIAARHVLDQLGDALPDAVLLLPTRRACSLMRQALIEALEGRTVLLPRILPLGDLEQELPGLLPPEAFEPLASVPPAMPEWRRLGLLMQQVRAFERSRQHHDVGFAQALGLASDLAALQDQCTRHGVALTMEGLRGLDIPAHYASHWESSLKFLAIVASAWPDIEAEEGCITSAARQVALLEMLAQSWEKAPPAMPIFAIGSTASQPVTARLVRAIAQAPRGQVILPGLDPRMAATRWQAVGAGHPLYHLKALLDGWGAAPAEVTLLGPSPAPSIWLDVLADSSEVAQWRLHPPASHTHLTILPAAHGEEEARMLSLLVREGVAQGKRTAIVTPDEGLMQRVGTHLERYGIAPDRMKQGSLATTETGSLWLAMLRYVANPARVLPLLSLLRHPLLLPTWADWLAEAEPAFRGLVRHQPGQLPPMEPSLRECPAYAAASGMVRQLASLNRRSFTVSQWMEHLSGIGTQPPGEGAEAVAEALEALRHADLLGPIDGDAFIAMLTEALAEPWRGGIYEGHSHIIMLTPVEARLERFDRVILANMQDMLWPGLAGSSAWLNMAQQQALGLPTPEENASLMAHDVLLLGSHAEVFLSYPMREQGSPTTRSRYIERLAAYLAVHGIGEETLCRPEISHWAMALHSAAEYAPAAPPMPTPSAERRPTAMAVSALDHLVSDPYWLYARYVLGLRELDPIDAEPEARELGTLVHAALHALVEHWNREGRSATAEELHHMQAEALAPFEARPEARLFWYERLRYALAFVNTQEAVRRQQGVRVSAEIPVRQPLAFDAQTLTLHGRIDRLEEGPVGHTIHDYKTGKIPSLKAMREGQAMQLLAYALLLQHDGKHVAGVDYWQLPTGRRDGLVQELQEDSLQELALIEQLHQLLACFMAPTTPLLARPAGEKELFPNPYDGLSRYDEWAG